MVEGCGLRVEGEIWRPFVQSASAACADVQVPLSSRSLPFHSLCQPQSICPGLPVGIGLAGMQGHRRPSEASQTFAAP
eukprot:365494-Rhodomonas_salina.1